MVKFIKIIVYDYSTMFFFNSLCILYLVIIIQELFCGCNALVALGLIKYLTVNDLSKCCKSTFTET